MSDIEMKLCVGLWSLKNEEENKMTYDKNFHAPLCSSRAWTSESICSMKVKFDTNSLNIVTVLYTKSLLILGLIDVFHRMFISMGNPAYFFWSPV